MKRSSTMARLNLAYPRPYRHVCLLQHYSDQEARRVSPCISFSRLLGRPVLPASIFPSFGPLLSQPTCLQKEEMNYYFQKCPRVSSDANATAVGESPVLHWMTERDRFFFLFLRSSRFLCEDTRLRDLSSTEDNDATRRDVAKMRYNVVVCLPKETLSLSVKIYSVFIYNYFISTYLNVQRFWILCPVKES